MAIHTLNLALDLPDETLSLDDVRAIAKEAGISLDDYVSRCIVSWSRHEAKHLADPELAATFKAAEETGPHDLRLQSKSA